MAERNTAVITYFSADKASLAAEQKPGELTTRAIFQLKQNVIQPLVPLKHLIGRDNVTWAMRHVVIDG